MIFIFQKERDFIMSNNFNFSENDYSEIIEMALSDHIPFSAIKNIYGIEEKEVKKIMRSKLKSKNTLSLTVQGKGEVCPAYT